MLCAAAGMNNIRHAGLDPVLHAGTIGIDHRLFGIPYPVVLDTGLEIWDMYGNQGWPGRYLWDPRGALFSMHYGEGAYAETELEIQVLLGVRSEERRVGKECSKQCRSRWSPYH